MEPNQAKVIFLIGPDKEAIESFPPDKDSFQIWFNSCHLSKDTLDNFIRGVNPEKSITFYYPEAGLSPIKQLEYGSLLVEVNKHSRPIYVVTHSQNIILRIRTLIQKSVANPSDYLIKYFSEGTITDIFIDNQSTLSPGLPMSWFGADLIEVLEW